MNLRRLLTGYFILVLIAMTWVSWHACVAPSTSNLAAYTGRGLNVIEGYVTVCREPWGLATMFDAYFGFLSFWLYIAWRENSWISRIAWLVALLLLGNFAIAGYALVCLAQSSESSLTKIFFTPKGHE
jgi:hypothetical protein